MSSKYFFKKKKDKAMVHKLKQLCARKGFAYTAYKLGEWDTQALKQWIYRDRIPKQKVERVKQLLEGEKK